MYMNTFNPSSDVIYGPYGAGKVTVNPSYAESGIPNTGLTWEKQLSYNVGFDFSMWNGKLAMEVDGFYNYIYDMLSAQGSGFPQMPVDRSARETGFVDESPKWLRPYLAAALRSGIICGYPAEGGAAFRPEQTVTAAEADRMMCNALRFAVPAAAMEDAAP